MVIRFPIMDIADTGSRLSSSPHYTRQRQDIKGRKDIEEENNAPRVRVTHFLPPHVCGTLPYASITYGESVTEVGLAVGTEECGVSKSLRPSFRPCLL